MGACARRIGSVAALTDTSSIGEHRAEPATWRMPSHASTPNPHQASRFPAHVPIYEYRCPNGHTFELFQRMSDPPADTCVTCGAGPVEKLLFPVAVHFKGSGFYSTDYGSRKTKAREGETSSSGEKSPEKSAEKPATDAKPKPSADAT
jgi:putative FmdB family regulatory protein